MVAFLDESVLNSRNPIFADWLRKPLQEELFGTHIAGEVFFQNLQQLLGRSDSQDLADLLEVHYLCLLLGFCGRYSAGNRGELDQIMNMTARQDPPHPRPLRRLSPAWMLPPETAARPRRSLGAKAGHHRGGLRRRADVAVRGLQDGAEQSGVSDVRALAPSAV